MEDRWVNWEHWEPQSVPVSPAECPSEPRSSAPAPHMCPVRPELLASQLAQPGSGALSPAQVSPQVSSLRRLRGPTCGPRTGAWSRLPTNG